MLLPLLYALPEGIVAGIPDAIAPHAVRESGLAAWGPVLAGVPDLLHAARRPPRRAVVTIPDTVSVTWLAAFHSLRRGSTLVLHARSLGTLITLADRILTRTRAGPAWRPAAELAASRRLRLRFVAGPQGAVDVREFLLGDRSPESVLAACVARGLTPVGSEIVYGRAWR